MTTVSVSGAPRRIIGIRAVRPVCWLEPWRIAELERDRFSGRVGMQLLSQSSRVRVWSIDLSTRCHRLPFHRHVHAISGRASAVAKRVTIMKTDASPKLTINPGQTKHFLFSERVSILSTTWRTSEVCRWSSFYRRTS